MNLDQIYLCVKCQQEIQDPAKSTIFCLTCKESEQKQRYHDFNHTQFLTQIAFIFIFIGLILFAFFPFETSIWGFMTLIFIYSLISYWIRYKKDILTKKNYILGISLLILIQIALVFVLINKF